jgi:serine/threonine-protein kinase
MAVKGDSGPESESVPRAGESIDGKFVVERVIGMGGMGVVLAARHAQLGQSVAIKVLRREAIASTDSVERFLREARAAAGLQSAHVVRVTDVGTLASGVPYMVMEHLVGTDLQRMLEERRQLPLDETVDYVLQAMEAVAEAHTLGLVHRDLKPANLFVTRTPDGSPLVKVLDFGISKVMEGGPMSQPSLTATTTIMGSPLYMSPEQVRSSKNVDARTDVWALGVILHELLAGAPPFQAETMTGLCARIVADPPEVLRARRPDVPTAFESVVTRCLDKDAAKRFQTVGELAVALRPFASAEGKMVAERISRIRGPRSAAGPGPAPAAVPPVAATLREGTAGTPYGGTQPAWHTSSTPRAARKRATVVTAGALLLLLVAGGLSMRLGRPRADVAPQAPAAAVAARTEIAAPVEPAPVVLAPQATAAAPAPQSEGAGDAGGAAVLQGSSAAATRPVRVAPAVPAMATARAVPRPQPSPAPPPASTQDLLIDRK